MPFFFVFLCFLLLLPAPLQAAMTGGNFEIYADAFSVVQDDLTTTGGNFTLYNTGGEPSGVLGGTVTGTIAVAVPFNGGEEFFLSDGQTTTTFTFRNRAGAQNGFLESGSITVDIGGGVGGNLVTMTGRIADAINHANANLEIDATSNGVSQVSLVNTRTSGSDGNVPITETVADAGFVVTGMSGGGSSSGIQLRGGFQAMERSSLSMSVAPSSVSLGQLSLAAVSTGSVVMTLSTDSSTGYAVSAAEDGNLRKGNGGGDDDINDVGDGTVTAGSEEYGISTSGSAGLLSSDTAISGTLSIAAASYNVTSQQTTITFKASVGGSSRAGSYSHIVTFTATANP